MTLLHISGRLTVRPRNRGLNVRGGAGGSICAFELLEPRVVLSLQGATLFPSDNPWNHVITNSPIAANSSSLINSIGINKPLHPDFGTTYAGANIGIPYNIVAGNQPQISVQIDAYPAESDVVPVPIPADAVIEGDPLASSQNTGDRHLIVYDKDNNVAYELFNAHRPSEEADNRWHADSEAVWQMNQNWFRTPGFTSADAAGLPILPGLVRPDEVLDQGVITHALRFTVPRSRSAYVFPASHSAGINSLTLPRMGERFRLKASVDISAYSTVDRVILQALKDYGMIVADNGSAWYLSGSPSQSWNDNELHALTGMLGSAFEAVDLTPIVSSVASSSGAAPQDITIRGANFTGNAGKLQVFFGSTPATNIRIQSDDTLIATAPSHPPGTIDVTVVTPYGQSSLSAADQFTYVAGPTSIVSRSIFYNNSFFDGLDSGISAADDRAIAPDKMALLPGKSAIFSNYTSYYPGINGIMVDLNSLPAGGTLSAADITLKAGTTGDPNAWALIPVTPQVLLRPGAGMGGSDRLEIVLPDRTAINEWVQVTLKATSNTGLSAPDVFYFGNLVGETGNDPSAANVTISDIARTKSANGTAADLISVLDFNRSGSITISDIAIAKSNNGAALPLIATPPSAPTSLSDTLTPAGVQLAWIDQSSVEAGFFVQRQTIGGPWVTLATLVPNSTGYFDGTATPGTAYQYQVIAAGMTANSAPSNVVYLVAPAPLQAPVNVAATPVSDTEVNLTWDRSGIGETSVTVWRSTGGGAFAKLTALAAGSNIYTDTSCYPGTAYSYQITADNILGSSPPSTSVAATTKASAATLGTTNNFTATTASPFTINLTWTDPASGFRNWLIERSTDGVYYSTIAVVPGSAASASYTDTPLSPSTTYFYRTRMTTGTGYGNYTAPITATTTARTANTPIEPTGFVVTVNSATSTTLTWSDPNGGASSYVIETAPFANVTPNWTQVGQTAAGATSYNLTTTAETFYYVRIRAKNAAGTSGYTAQVIFRTASPGSGSPQVYKIGPGQAYTSLAALNWSQLGPGDTVQIFPNKDANGTIIPYYEKPMISVRGTAANPINIIGMADPVSGQLPIIDGTNAVTAAQWNTHAPQLDDASLVLVGTRAQQNTTSYAWSPGYINLSNLDIRSGYSGNPGTIRTYTAFDGNIRNYTQTCGIYIEKGDNITIKGCVVHDNNEGIFAAGQGDARNLEQLTLDSNYIYGNGTINDASVHNSYLEGIGTLYQFNKYGPLRAGALGSGMKDRGPGTIIRYNSIQGGGHLVDLVESQNYYTTVMALPSYHQTYMYGNIFYNTGTLAASTPIHYGGDQGLAVNNRKGVLHFYNNTLVDQTDQSKMYKATVFKLETPAESLDARDNIIYFRPDTTQTPSDLYLLPPAATAYFGKNWVSPAWKITDPGYTFIGHAAGISNLITNGSNDPGFVNAAGQDFNLVSNSQNIDGEDVLSGDEPPVLFQYSSPNSGKARPINGAALDLGASEYGN